MKMFRIFDSKAAAYSNPFYEHTDESALRAFVSAVQDPENSGMRGNPLDYSLVGIGDIEHDQALPVLTTPYTLADGVTALNYAREQQSRLRAEVEDDHQRMQAAKAVTEEN